MGRILVFLFLGTVAFAVLTAVIGLVHFVRDVLAAVGGIVSYPDLATPFNLPPALAFNGIWFEFAVYYFFVVAPIGVFVLLVWHFLVRNRPSPWKKPHPIDWTKASVAVVLTAYDDQASIGSAVDDFKGLPLVHDIIVVDNNSKDRTSEVASAHGATVVRETNQGYGYACIAGMRYALTNTTNDIIVLCEGDMTFYGDDLAKFLPYMADCDMVIGTRNTRTLTREGSQMNWFMSWGNLFLALMIRLRYWDWSFLGRVQLTDVGCTYRAIRREALARMIDRLTVGSHHFSPHMILVALREYLAVTEVPIKFRARVGESKGAGGDIKRAIAVGITMIGSIAIH
ncbi:MAG: glycosyltransferase family 2 protein [Thermoplasmata archaeon]|jgi:cellulose synthase/poly-beta-1,6-N-acetylglucosamine synthase-like glycosyltransferase